MSDRFNSRSASIDGPATHGFAITPNDSVELTEITRALYVGTAGDIAVTLSSGAEITFDNVASGTVLPIRVQFVKATNTTASNLLGLV